MMQYDLPKHLWKDGSMGMETLSRERFVALYLHVSCYDATKK